MDWNVAGDLVEDLVDASVDDADAFDSADETESSSKSAQMDCPDGELGKLTSNAS